MTRTLTFTNPNEDAVIYSKAERLFWSNADGWGDLDSATRFKIIEFIGGPWPNLPIGGELVTLKDAKKLPVDE